MFKMKLTDREWKAFYISDEKENGVFKLRASLSGIDKNKLLDSNELSIPYITRSDFNNGVSLFVGKEQKDKFKIDNGNVITIGLDTQTVFYQPYPFYTGQNIQVLYNDHLDKYVAKFIIPLLKMQVSKLSWGGNGATLGRLKRMQLLLPISDDGQPDYTFMEMFIKEREAQKRKEYLDYCKEQLKIIGGGYNLIPLADKQWKAFFIGGDNGLFEIYSGKRLTVANMTEGECPFIGATDSNNGITNWVGNRNETYDSNVLGVNYNGSVVENFYHPYHCIFSDDVKRLHLKECEDNKFALLFFSRLILMQKAKYTYGYKFNGTRMNRQKILVPIADSGEPDYEYMEKYSRNLLRDKIQRYIDYAAN